MRELVIEHDEIFLKAVDDYFIFVNRVPRTLRTARQLVVHLADGRTISALLEWFPRLRDASKADRRQERLIGQGVGIHWEALDEDPL